MIVKDTRDDVINELLFFVATVASGKSEFTCLADCVRKKALDDLSSSNDRNRIIDTIDRIIDNFRTNNDSEPRRILLGEREILLYFSVFSESDLDALFEKSKTFGRVTHNGIPIVRYNGKTFIGLEAGA